MSKKFKKIRLFIGFGILLPIVAIVLVFFALKSSFNNQNLEQELNAKGVHLQSAWIPYHKYKIYCRYIGNREHPKVLLIHGSPGSWSDFKNVFSDSLLRENFCLISYDRPGYGKTALPVQEFLSEQAKVAEAIMDYFLNADEKCIVVGHSFGGAVLEECLIKFPGKIKHAIYAAPCLSPQFQKAKWYNVMISGGLPNQIMPNELRNSNKEMMALSNCLLKNEKHLKNISVPTTYIQGKKDILVPYETLYYYQKHCSKIKYKLLPEMNHFIPWSNPELIITAINKTSEINNPLN